MFNKSLASTMEDEVYINGNAEYYTGMRSNCKEAVDIVVNYLENVENFKPFPEVQSGFLVPQIPSDPPKEAVTMQEIFKDVDRLLIPGVTHWNHPRFHAYFAMANSYPAVCADIIGSAIRGMGFTWASSPVSTELEYVVTNWLAKMLGLPDFYLHSPNGGGGVVNVSGLLNLIPVRSLPVNNKFELTGETLETAILEDIAEGKIPFYCVATLGTTSVCSFDKLNELGPVCKKFDVWLHVDADYAGSAFICPEYRHYLHGSEFTSSFAFNPRKWPLTNFDCSVVWFKDVSSFTSEFATDAQYLKYSDPGKMPDYRNWQLSFSRKSRALNLWFVIRKFGVADLQKYIRQHIRMAKYLESLIKSDIRFEIIGEVTMGHVCFRIKGSNKLTKKLYESIRKDGRIYLTAAWVKTPNEEEIHFIRVAIASIFTDEGICNYAFMIITEVTDKLTAN
ncbi:unnamed protein product [Hymenolepis diminuta]|uniref:Aromatic-L-amino-acid decarboxylase n=1 Tax=Hymenolepis diminuta TaxID=6216 RepID=A0A3P6ZG18_HYMDI|nr:unnamed protein product [Hymenolepis diminuta]